MTCISVIIPVRNRPVVIQRAIDSVLAQTRPVNEIVVVDDGSTDDTPDVVQARALPIPLRLIRRGISGGAPSARNEGARASVGTLLAFLDSDDSWHPDKIAEQVTMLDALPDAVAAFTNIQRIRDGVLAERTKVPSRIDLAGLFESNILGGCSTAMVRRSAFEQVGGFRPGLPSCQDWDLWLRLASLGPLVCTEKSLTNYFFDGSDRISSNTERVLEGHKIVMEEIYSLVNLERAAELRRIHLNYLMETAFFSLRDRVLGRKLALRSLLRPIDTVSFLRAVKLVALENPIADILRSARSISQRGRHS